MLKLRAQPQTGLSCSQQTLEILISGGQNDGAERYVCLFKLDIKGEVMLLSIMGPFPTQRWGLLLMTWREITSKNSILLKDTFIPVLWYPCAVDHFLHMKIILLGPEITQIYKNNLIGKEKFSAWRAWDNVQFQIQKVMRSRRWVRFLLRSTLLIWYAKCCLLESLPVISINESRLSVIPLCNLILTVQNKVEHLSLFGAWETSNHIICSSLIRTPRTVPFLSLLSKTFFANASKNDFHSCTIQWLTVEVASPRTVPAGLSYSPQTEAALSVPLPFLVAPLSFDSL